jgi:hypothetical protein
MILNLKINPNNNIMRVIFKEKEVSLAADPLAPPEVYSVYGMFISKVYTLEYLLVINPRYEILDMPNWYEAKYFDVCDDQLPPSWHFRYYQNKPDYFPLIAMWGYKELVECEKMQWPPNPGENPEHYLGLIERYQSDLTLFRQRKQEMDEELGYIKKDPYDW